MSRLVSSVAKYKTAVDLFFLLILALYILAGMNLTPFHGDESTQVYMSRDFAYQFLQGDTASLSYTPDPASAQEQDLRLLNGSVNKYSIGLAWWLAGFELDAINEQWDWGADYHYNTTTQHAPSPELLQVARLPSTLFTLLATITMFYLGKQLGGRRVATIATLFFVLHPAVLVNGRRAMMEGSLLAFSLLTVWAGVWFLQVRRGQHRRFFFAVMVLGICGGLALASKHTAVFTLIAVWGGLGLSLLLPQTIDRKLRLFGLVMAGIVALIVFYVLNPVWWGQSPFAMIEIVLAKRSSLLAGQAEFFGGYLTVPEALIGFYRQTGMGMPQYFEVDGWQTYIGDQISVYNASHWTGVLLPEALSGIILLLAGVGLVRFFISPSALPHRLLIGGWAILIFASTMLLTPLEWQRYYLPMMPVLALLAGLAWMPSNRVKPVSS